MRNRNPLAIHGVETVEEAEQLIAKREARIAELEAQVVEAAQMRRQHAARRPLWSTAAPERWLTAA